MQQSDCDSRRQTAIGHDPPVHDIINGRSPCAPHRRTSRSSTWSKCIRYRLHARLAFAESVYILLSVIELLSGVATSTAEDSILDCPRPVTSPAEHWHSSELTPNLNIISLVARAYPSQGRRAGAAHASRRARRTPTLRDSEHTRLQLPRKDQQ